MTGGGSDRQRRWRERAKRGLDVYRLTLPTDEVVEALIEHDFLTEEQATDHAQVCAALERLLLILVRQSRDL